MIASTCYAMKMTYQSPIVIHKQKSSNSAVTVRRRTHSGYLSSAPSPMATVAQEVVSRPKPIQMEVDKFDGKEGDNLMVWFRQVESAMFIADITYEPYRVGFATGKLGGLAKQWALTCCASLQDAFPT
ncbi:unnamed protein product [Peronospora belbahrii]|uniref:Retrotransposon gag domain-containing protein n=1 Tax=Peronospora belbahrii TaxID=622444 RepID=A0AAU9LB99_9STRA|nr:unnamed protein product [Peronospora belbahrii]